MNLSHLHPIEIEIIQFLFAYKNEYLPSQRIADNSQISSKTVRKYIHSLNESLEPYAAVIEMKRGTGYQLVIHDNNRFYPLLDAIREQTNTIEDTHKIKDSSDRERFILNVLLLENKQMTIDALSETLFLSKSSISAVIQKIRKDLETFDLYLSYDLDGSIRINGKEFDKRRFILNYFFVSRADNHYLDNDLMVFNREGFSAETIFIIVLENCREYDIQLSDFVLQNLVLHISLAIKRNEKGFTIDDMAVNAQVEYSKELFVAKRIVSKIEELMAISFSKNEVNYIALHLKSKSHNTQITDLTNEGDISLHEQIIATLTRMQNELNFSMDQQLVKGIEVHFEPLLTRLKLNIHLKNPLVEEVKEKYSEVFALTTKYFTRLPVLSDYTVDDNEIAYIALHILAAVERYKQNHKVNVLVICATGLGSAQMLKNRLENTFAANMNIVDVISYYQLNDATLKEIDLLITTIDISTSFYNVPVVKVSVFLNKKDIERLNQAMHAFPFIKEETAPSKREENPLGELFHRYFNESRFIVFNSTVTREEARNQMIERLTDASNSSFKKDLITQIQVRERFGTLAFTPEVAFPHPAQPIGLHSELVVGVIPTGLEWDPEHPAIKVVVLLSPSRIENKGLDIINQGLAEFISQEENVYALIKDATFDQFKQLFSETLTN
ncbi:BglG family transcription antiterminator [Jeotgalibaca porci]|uniref:BglG family transcription antiterminator n=1 Tax=Jeotgalibaca porci TaxID=1868793 RepID=UPI003F8EC0D9